MATHLVAYSQSVDTAGSLTAIGVVSDDVLTRTSPTRFLVPADYRFVRWAVATGPSLTDARLRSPSLGVRRMDVLIYPRRRGGNTLDISKPEVFIPRRPVALTPNEELEAVTAEDAAGASQMNVLVALGPEALPDAPTGDLRIVRFIGTTTLTPFTWTTVPVTPELSLEPGTYALVDFIPVSAGCIAARAIIVGQVYRPGKPGLAGSEATAVDFDDALYRQTGGYLMGSFTHITIPQFQFLSSSADTTQVVIATLVKTG